MSMCNIMTVIVPGMGIVMAVTMIMAVAVQAVKPVTVSFGFDLTHGIGVLVQALVGTAVGLAVYGTLAGLLRLEEASLITRGLEKFFRLGQNGNGANGARG